MEKIQEFMERLRENHLAASEFPVDVTHQFLAGVFLGPEMADKGLLKEVCSKYIDSHCDVWYYSTTLLRNIALVSQYLDSAIPAHESHLLRISNVMKQNSMSPSATMTRVFHILDQIKKPTSQLSELEPLIPAFGSKKLSHFRVAFKNCWIEVLRGSSTLLGRDTLIKLLRILPDTVMPHIPDAQIFSSFFCHCFEQNKDIDVSLLSISGLFLLISRYNLGEPSQLYRRLYQLVSADSLGNHRSATRVFQMIIKALRSPLMPSQCVPVFAKKLIRTAVIVGNPSLTLWLVVAAFNLMQANPTVSKTLVHADSSLEFSNMDPFDLGCTDIDEALISIERSCLWELELLMNHSDPSVVRMANLYKTNFFSKRAKRISSDDYLLISADQLMQRELKFGRHASKMAKANRASVELETLVGMDTTSNPSMEIPLRHSLPQDSHVQLKRKYECL